MGAHSSKNSNDHRWIQKRSSHLRSVLSKKREEPAFITTITPQQQQQQQTPPPPPPSPPQPPQPQPQPPLSLSPQVPISLPTPTLTPPTIIEPTKRTITSHYDPLKSNKQRRKNSPKVMSSISNTSTDNMSSGWTTLSNDPFSQIEVLNNTSAFTEITDQSTISRKSLFPVLEDNHYNIPSTTSLLLSPVTAHDILQQLTIQPTEAYRIIKDAYARAQQQDDPFDWNQFYLAMDHYTTLTKSNISLVYLAKCYMSGLGTAEDKTKGLDLLRSNPSCESMYALGHCYLQKGEKESAFKCFQNVIQCTVIDESTQSTIAEAQCISARMLFQGEGVEQNTNKALQLLIQSAEHNMRAQFFVGVHYERGSDLEQDLEKAKYYYEKSATQGFPDAQAALGSRYVAECNYAKGIEWLEKSVHMGCSRAHVQLGILYDRGQGIQQNDEMALFHYKAAVENNSHPAEYILGLVYYFGRLGRQKNNKEAIRLIKSAAMAGLPQAQRVYAQFYQQGIIPDPDRRNNKKNEKNAIRWFHRAASEKDVLALGSLGKCYEYGKGVEIDLEKALGYYSKAAEQSGPFTNQAQIDQALLLQRMGRHIEAFKLYSIVLATGTHLQSVQTAHLSVARYHLHRDIEGVRYDPKLAHDMLIELVQTSNDVHAHAHYWLGSIYDEGIAGLFEIDRQKAFHHFTIAAEGGDNDATFLVAYMMSNHVIPGKGPIDAFPWYEKAAIKGHRMSMYSLGLCYYKGIGTQIQFQVALEWFEKSAKLGVTGAISYMSRIYLQFMVSSTDPTTAQHYFVKAYHWLKRGVENKDTYSERELGKIYLTGKGLPVDYSIAFELLQRAALKHDGEATTFLGDCYHKGTGTEKNLQIAIEHYLRASELGYPFAYSAAAALYYEIGNLELAYDYYLLASKQPKLINTKIGKMATMMVARLSLGLVPPIQSNLLQPLTQPTITPKEAFDSLSQLAITDQFPHAFQALASCYLQGTGTEVNPVQAIFWFRKSAQELNDSIAYFNLAEIYSTFEPTDIPLAFSYLTQSADMGYTEAQYRLGMIYLNGDYGVPVNERTAAIWFKQAASKLHVESIWRLSLMARHIGQSELELDYQKKAASLGHVVSMRLVGEWYLKQLEETPFLNALMQHEYLDQALKFLHLAGDAGDTESLVILGKAYTNCTKTRVKFSASATEQYLPTPTDFGSDHDDEEEEGESRFQCEEDEKNLAIECFERASNLGDIHATVYAAEAWYEQKQYAAALEYFEKAASQGNVLARFFCARYCIEGYGGSQLNPEKGFQELLICANELNCVHAYNNLGQCYENGIGTIKNDQLAYEWYCRAAESTRDAEAFYRIGQMYAQERIETNNHKDLEALKIYQFAVNATPENHGLASYQLGLYYLKGIIQQDTDEFVLPPDICLAIEYFRTASDLNVKEAMLQLAMLFLNDDYTLEEQEEGVSRLNRASQLGLREAQFELGLFYHRGKEFILDNTDEEEEEEECILIPQDFEKAYDLFCRAANQNHPAATYYLGIYHQHGIFVAPDLSIALEQYEISVSLFEKYDDPEYRWQAEFNLARILHQDLNSRAYAYELFQSAHLHAPKQFKFLAQIMIARYHLFGWADVTVQAEEAAATLLNFAQHEPFGYRVYLQVAQCFEQGLGLPQDPLQAFHWYGQVVNKSLQIENEDMAMMDEEIEEDEAFAMFKLAEFYRQGLVVAKDEEKAENLYNLAARKGSQDAQDYLSIMLERTTLYD